MAASSCEPQEPGLGVRFQGADGFSIYDAEGKCTPHSPPPVRTLREREEDEREGERMTGVGLRRRGRARPGGWPLLDLLLDGELQRSWGSGTLHRRPHSTSSSWCGGRQLLQSCGRRRPQRVVDDTCIWCSTHGFRPSPKYSGQIRPRPMVEKTDYRDKPLEHVFMGCSRARCRSSPEGRRVGRRG